MFDEEDLEIAITNLVFRSESLFCLVEDSFDLNCKTQPMYLVENTIGLD